MLVDSIRLMELFFAKFLSWYQALQPNEPMDEDILLHTSTHCFCQNVASDLKSAKTDGKWRVLGCA
jgi:hypothetical protein